ncbi:hypothetical protein [Luteolibacter marinus]|uniref:hypothetical protein n=1 Tax=Luteolibacter marinus TaxID=2776705 RepID=UPI001868C6B9|nr:hypothetical protein [Luteolibacter marinus]
MKFHLPLLVLVSGPLFAQGEAVKHTLRILPLGDPPPFVQEVRNGVRYELPAPEGSVPPRSVLLSPAAAGGEDAKELALRLRLGTPSAEVSFPLPEERSVTVRTEAGGAWLKIPLSKADASLALVWRGGKLWDKARVLTVPDTARDGDFRFINVTAKPMAVTWGSEKLKLNPATTMIRRAPAGARTVALSIQFPVDGGLRPCLVTEAEVKAGSRQDYLIYAADGDKPRLPVKVLALSERL